jgi:ATP synthase protein I
MAEPGNDQDRLDAFAARVKSVGDSLRPPPEKPLNRRQSSALGMAFRLSTELVIGVAVGGAIGWALDRWLETSPVLLLVFLMLGMAAGFKTAWDTTRAMNRSMNGPDAGSE